MTNIIRNVLQRIFNNTRFYKKKLIIHETHGYYDYTRHILNPPAKVRNNIKNYYNIHDLIKSNPYKIVYNVPQIKNYDNNIIDLIKSNPYEYELVVPQIEDDYQEIHKLALIDSRLFLELPYALKNIPPEFMTEEICKLALKTNGYALECVPHELITDEMCNLALQQNGLALQYVPPELMTEEICKIAVQQDDYTLHYIKNKEMREKIRNLL